LRGAVCGFHADLVLLGRVPQAEWDVGLGRAGVGRECGADVGGRKASGGRTGADMRDELERLRKRLEELRVEGKFDEDVDAAYWTADRALSGRGWGGIGPALDYAREVVGRYESGRKRVEMVTRGISKAEHDALVGGDRPKIMTRDEYERMMREAQE